MPIIMERIDYSNKIPRLPFLDTRTGIDYSIDLYAGRYLPTIGLWLDKRYCRCGNIIPLSKRKPDLGDPQLERALDYLCPDCALEDRINLCSLKGVRRRIISENSIECEKCFKYLSSCSSGYCVYLSILSETPSEVKVGVTYLDRLPQRAMEGGYAAIAVLLPRDWDSLSLPEAQFIEKDLFRGIKVEWENRILRVGETFTRDIGFVNKDFTKQQTISALLSPPSKQLEKTIENIALSTISEARKMASLYKFPIAEKLASLEIVDMPDITNGDVKENDLRSFELSDIVSLKRRQLGGRPAKLLPVPSKIVAVKGPCVLLSDEKKCYALRLSRSQVQGKEAFDYDRAEKTRYGDDHHVPLDWFNCKES